MGHFPSTVRTQDGKKCLPACHCFTFSPKEELIYCLCPPSGPVAAPCVWSSIAEEEMPTPPEEVANKEVSPPLRILGASRDCIRESGLACQDSVASRGHQRQKPTIYLPNVAPVKETGSRTNENVDKYGRAHHNLDLGHYTILHHQPLADSRNIKVGASSC